MLTDLPHEGTEDVFKRRRTVWRMPSESMVLLKISDANTCVARGFGYLSQRACETISQENSYLCTWEKTFINQIKFGKLFYLNKQVN